ncbi:hypothetical protein PV326_010964 [Microctonus aethiopoides]|uniref:Synaptic plasticity regulator PANTS n=1 Tax=Microctonus aethiopoides TaxID=144406 RepID=A0AA39CAT1_9HYME|nr:hypothetical protein PV326_010964 [Microctonus aethiopoides]KAK0160968.1 hypothetical protein PV328_008312 [Microctonus aethiopoides]
MNDSEENVKENMNEEKSQETETDIDDSTFPKYRDSDWMLKPCHVYLTEYKDCRSILGRFYQNFYYGEMLNCTQWKTDYENCLAWQSKDDDIAFNELLTSEKKRRLERLAPHVQNNVWKNRTAPPSDWNNPLPEWMAQRNKGTYFDAKQKAIENDTTNYGLDNYLPSCTIL